jgi:hypothetical protein
LLLLFGIVLVLAMGEVWLGRISVPRHHSD